MGKILQCAGNYMIFFLSLQPLLVGSLQRWQPLFREDSLVFNFSWSKDAAKIRICMDSRALVVGRSVDLSVYFCDLYTIKW